MFNLTYRRLIFMQHLVVLGHGHTEYDRGHVLEAVDPFLSLGPLPAHVEQSGTMQHIGEFPLSPHLYNKEVAMTLSLKKN